MRGWNEAVMIPEAARDRLERAHLLPPFTPLSPGELGLVPDVGVDVRSRFRGSLLAGAVGDALGRPFETKARQEVDAPVTDFRPWRGWRSGPIGTITDDTQLTMLVAEWVIAGDRDCDPEWLAARLVDWLPSGRGVGSATRAAVGRLGDGVPWWDAGERSAGNGAAMRSAPIGLVSISDPQEMRQQAALCAVVTHAHPMAVVSAVVMAFATAWCACRAPGSDATDLLEQIARFGHDLHDDGEKERRRDRDLGPIRLLDRLAEVGDLLDRTSDQAFDHFYNGAFVLESLPAALWCFLRSPFDLERVLVTAASGGRDADTVAAMAGNLVGALNGEDAIPKRWLAELEYRDRLRELADALLDRSGLVPRFAGRASAGAAQGGGVVPSRRSRIRGCLLAGAMGDALGAAVEFDSLATIHRRFGPDGITTYAPAYGRLGAITDDTQMTLFTAEGLIRARQRFHDRGICHVPSVINSAYFRWLKTQGIAPRPDPELGSVETGWLLKQHVLHSRRAPGTTCLAALQAGGMGSIDRPINDSKGCGGVMRVAPVGLIANDPFRLAADAAALTHGHPNGYLAAGAFAEIISILMHGEPLEIAVQRTRDHTAAHPDGAEVANAIDHAMRLASTPSPTVDAIGELGEGWIAEEALAISIYCALVADDVRDGLIRAVNHGGDSDSTGAITGNILGVLLGEQALPADLLANLEARDIIEQLADDLATDDILDWQRYPPN